MKRKIFLIIPILLVSAIALSACTKTDEMKDAFNKGYEQGESILQPENGQDNNQNDNNIQIEETSEQDWVHDYTTAVSLLSQLNERYEIAQANNSLELDSQWFVDFNHSVRDLISKYNNEINTNDPQYKVKTTLGLVFGDLRTLGQEYEKDLKGNNSDIDYFKGSIANNLEILKSEIK